MDGPGETNSDWEARVFRLEDDLGKLNASIVRLEAEVVRLWAVLTLGLLVLAAACDLTAFTIFR